MDDFQVDDLLAKHREKKKKINSGDKGHRGEHGVIDRLNERFKHIIAAHPDWGQFSRSAGSGNRWGQVKGLSQAAKEAYAGDITIVTNCRWVFESKNGYDDVDIFRCFKGKCTELDEFLEQVERDGQFTGRKPMLVWKKTRQERIAFVKVEDLPGGPKSDRFAWPSEPILKCGYSILMFYKDWVGVPFPEILTAPDEVFFDGLGDSQG